VGVIPALMMVIHGKVECMLVVKDMKYLEKVISFASQKSPGHEKNLWLHLWKLHGFFNDLLEGDWNHLAYVPGRTSIPKEWNEVSARKFECSLHVDFAPASFEWYLRKAGSAGLVVYHGGLIYHGEQGGWEMPNGKVISPGHAVETYSITLTEETYWQIHT
jgi:hypothetical protein